MQPLIFQIMDCKYYSGNQPYLPILKEDVGEDVKDKCKAGPQTQKKVLLVCLDNWLETASQFQLEYK